MQAADWKTYFDSTAGKSGRSHHAGRKDHGPGYAGSQSQDCASNLAARTTPEYAAFPQWLQREIWAAPAIFVDSKAFLYTRLKGAGVDWLVRSSRG